MTNYQLKYLKYKKKYLNLIGQKGGANSVEVKQSAVNLIDNELSQLPEQEDELSRSLKFISSSLPKVLKPIELSTELCVFVTKRLLFLIFFYGPVNNVHFILSNVCN